MNRGQKNSSTWFLWTFFSYSYGSNFSQAAELHKNAHERKLHPSLRNSFSFSNNLPYIRQWLAHLLISTERVSNGKETETPEQRHEYPWRSHWACSQSYAAAYAAVFWKWGRKTPAGGMEKIFRAERGRACVIASTASDNIKGGTKCSVLIKNQAV